MRRKWSLLAAPVTPSRPLPSVVVIGAGMAGLVTARLLHDSGFPVTVLEARERLGGRTWTDESLGVPLDLGGSWIHGADHNPLTDWCKALNIPLVITSDGERYWFENHQGVARSAVWRQAWRGRWLARFTLDSAATYQRLARRLGHQPQLSLGTVIEPLLRSNWLPELDRRVVASLVSTSEGVQGAPANFIDIEDWFPGEAHGVNAMPVGGYKRLIDDAAEGLTIHCHAPVEAIATNGDGVTIVTSQTTFHADLAVVTVPLGILKANRIRFEPALPAQKLVAIQRIGYGGEGVLGKLFMRFAKRFWPADKDWLMDLPKLTSERGIFTTWTCLEAVVGAPVLLAFANGQAAANFDRYASDDEVYAAAMDVLNRMFPGKVVPPEQFIYTRWLSDPWALGSYTYPAVGSPLSDRDAYQEPVGGRLYFAGEGTQKADFGTVHAALRSGEQAAEAIVRAVTGQQAVRGAIPWAAH